MQKLFKPQLRTKNFSAADLKAANAGIGEFPARAIVRLGSRTSTQEAFPKSFGKRTIIEVNTPEACHNSGDKVLMKQCFDAAGVRTAEWSELHLIRSANEWNHGYPAIIKHKNSCKGKGIYFINNQDDLQNFLANNNTRNHIIESYKGYTKEFRLHVTEDGCFYACRKMLKADAEERWHRHDTNSVWIIEENPLFERPKNWDDLEAECVKALKAVGLDIGACDVKIQSEKNRNAGFIPEFVILEINSAAGLAERGLELYRVEIAKIITKKIENGR